MNLGEEESHTHTDRSPHPTLSHPRGSRPGLHLWRPLCSLTVCTLQSTGGDSVEIVTAHHEPQTLSLPRGARVLLRETEAPEKSKRRRGLPQGGRRQTSRGCSQRHPAHLCSPHPRRGNPQPVYWGETLIRAHHVVFCISLFSPSRCPTRGLRRAFSVSPTATKLMHNCLDTRLCLGKSQLSISRQPVHTVI